MKAALLIVLVCLSGCSWMHSHKPAPVPPELIVTGVPAGSILFLDGVQTGQAEDKKRTEVLRVVPGTHVVEVRRGDTVVYRENTYAGPGDRRVITVLSGTGRY